jgi:hypothetical protein
MPIEGPSRVPSIIPSETPSPKPSNKPGGEASDLPSGAPSMAPSVFPRVIPSVFSSIESSVSSDEVLSEVPSVRPSEWPSVIPSVIPVDNPSDVRVVLFCGDPTDYPTSDSIQKSIRNSNSYTNNEHSVNIRGSPNSVPCVVPTNIPSGKPSEYPAADQAAKCDEGLRDELNATLSAVPSIYQHQKPSSTPKSQPIQLLCMTPTVIPSMFQLIFHHLSKVRSSFQVLRVGGIVRDDEWSCSGECFEIVCFYFIHV